MTFLYCGQRGRDQKGIQKEGANFEEYQQS